MQARSRSAMAALALWTLALGTLVPQVSATPREPQLPVPPMMADAQLADVTFVDAQHGWAVGDRGVIWHTSDGGAQWTLQPSGVECRLTSITFVDAQNGWIAGGYTQPFTHTSTGVILRTRDGGQHWTADRKSVLPAIERLRFFDAQRGWGLGRTSAFFPSGMFATDDGGKTWTAVSAVDSRDWLTGDMIDSQTGALAGRSSAVAVVRKRTIEAQPADHGLRALRAMKLVAPANGWLVGDGGLVLSTRDLGKSWQTPEHDIPAELRRQFDFSAVAVRGPRCWIAGAPGTRILHTADGGQSWQTSATGQNLPMQAITFPDDQHGWAVGDLGTILATADGGQTWRTQRAGGTRSALLGFSSGTAGIPLELIARLSAEEGYLAACEILNREDIESAQAFAADAPRQAHEASVLAGGSVARSAWQFPLRSQGLKLSAEQMVEVWNRANDGKAVEKLEAYVVSRIRMWRPNVVVTLGSDSRGTDPLAHIINQVVLRAAERAGDPTQFAEQLSAAGLEPWKVQKVYGALPDGETGTTNLNTAQLSSRQGRSIGELAAAARGVLSVPVTAPQANVGFRLLVNHIPQEVGQRDFFSGISLPPGGDARRRYEEVTENKLEAIKREAQMRRNLQAILNQAENDSRDGRFLAGIGDQTRSLDPARAAEVLFQLAQRYHQTGKWELAADCFGMIAERYPNHPLGGSSLVWLIQYYASGEAAWRNRAAQQFTVEQATARPPKLKPGGEDLRDERRDDASGVRRATAISAGTRVDRAGGLIADARNSNARLAQASNWAKQLEGLQPTLYGEPSVRFPLGVVWRQQGLPRQAERFFLALRHNRPHDAWWACAQTELWMVEPKGDPPKQFWNCNRTADKPRLDGRLDEPVWQAASRAELTSPQRDDAEWRGVVMLAYDDEFLYLGISCPRAPGFDYLKSDTPRPRDPDLSSQDRVELLLDIDRDFATYYRLTIDHRGWTGESCWRDVTWNPQWFVAAEGDERSWQVEAAIPLSELAPNRPAPRTTWAVGAQRIVPGVGFQSWNTPAAAEIVPEGFGYLSFR